MITVCAISEVKKENYDEVWLITRSPGKVSLNGIKHIPALSPSKSLFFGYLNKSKANQWNKQTFESWYVPEFINELKRNIIEPGDTKSSYDYLNELFTKDQEDKRIALCCFCTPNGKKELLCHRLVIAAILKAVSCKVNVDGLDPNNTYYNQFMM